MSEKQFKIDTTSEFGSIFINNPNGEHMSWVEVEQTLNKQQATIERLKEQLALENKKSRHFLHKYFQLRKKLDKIPPKIKEVWLEWLKRLKMID